MELFADFALAGHQSPHQAGLKVDAVLVDRAVEQLLLRAFVFAGVVVVKPDFAQCDSLSFAKQRCYMRKLAFTRI